MPVKQTWLSEPNKPGCTCVGWTTNLATLSSASGWNWRCWTLINQVHATPRSFFFFPRSLPRSASVTLPWRLIHFLFSLSALLESANIIRFASRLAGGAAHRCQPRVANSPAGCWHHSPMCSLWYSRSAISVVQERAGAPRQEGWHATGKHRLFAYLSSDRESLHSQWWIDVFN